MLPVIRQQMRNTVKIWVPHKGPMTSLDDLWSYKPVECPAYFYEDTRLIESPLGDTKVKGRLGYLLLDKLYPEGSKVEIYRGDDLVGKGYLSVGYTQRNMVQGSYIKIPVGDWIYPGFKPVLVTFSVYQNKGTDDYGQDNKGWVDLRDYTNVLAHKKVYSLDLDENLGVELAGYIIEDAPDIEMGMRISECGTDRVYKIVKGQEFTDFVYIGGQRVGSGDYLQS